MYVLEWNQASNGFHIQQLERALASNLDAFYEGRRVAYVPIATGTHDEMTALAAQLRPTLAARQDVARASGKSFAAYQDGIGSVCRDV